MLFRSALTLVMALLMAWRASSAFGRFAFLTNTTLMAAGLLLVGYQLTGYALGA